MFRLKGHQTIEQIVKKSRFRAVAIPVENEAEVRAALASHSDISANHNCFAWRIGNAYRFNDDGEPAGTAGKPIFQALENKQLDSALVIVSRWFGGVLLGTGGLARAYGGTAAACLDLCTLEEVFPSVMASTQIPFSDLETLRFKVKESGAVKIISESFDSEGCVLTLEIRREEVSNFALLISGLTRGRSRIQIE